MNFLRNLLAAIIGCIIAIGILFVMFFVFLSLMGSGQNAVTVKNNSVLELKLKYPINDYVGDNETDPFAKLFKKSEGLDEILHAIAVAKNDDRIKGISINNTHILAGLAQTQAIRNALEDFKESGKFIYSYGDIYMQKDYYLGSVSDSTYIHPVGIMDFKGLSTEVLYYKDLQEKSGVKMEVIRHGKYKSAVEPFLENKMSDANRTQLKELLGSLWNSMVRDMAKDRKMTPENLNEIADDLGARTPELAKENGLIDDILFEDQYEDIIRKSVGLSPGSDINYISLANYAKEAKYKKLYSGDAQIAVVYAQGEIMYGEGSPETIGQDLLGKALKKARENESVKAIVLRVNSPGGSSLVSDIIWREVELAKKIKPVVVSMGNVAASGGYYIASGANKIFAEPTTITGSIGVFGTIPNMSGLAGDIGINAEQVGTNKNSADYSLFDPMSESFRNTIQEGVESTYHTFLSRVSTGRGMAMAQVDSIAQGRVWSGVDAQRLGLVDEIGGLDDAIAGAAHMVGLKSYGITKFPKYKTGLERFKEDLGGASSKIKEHFIEQEIGAEAYSFIKKIKGATEQKGIQARMPVILDIK